MLSSNQEDMMSIEELEVYGVDWEGLQDDHLLQSRQHNNPASEGSTSWLIQTGAPNDLNEVRVESPQELLSEHQIEQLDMHVSQWRGMSQEDGVIRMWIEALGYMQLLDASY